ncbi:MAG: class III extradiol ring-cleavage dioxygenase [Candidatus Nanopelagicales bacterium]|nr:class III extradiol ring-cleavage dioxygenase [Candidatus Nanopelagicales bacterium]
MSNQRAGAAFDAFLPDALKQSQTHRTWTGADGPMPALFISHGAPPLFDDGAWMKSLLKWTTSLPKPTAIVMISAHWESAPIAISSSSASTPLVYDFGGFDPRYFNMKYETPDASTIAKLVNDVLPDNAPIHEHKNRGLDHGAWVPLKAMYPLGDVPVIQLSLPTARPDRLRELGNRLRPLREQGVLIVGSGFWTHGLPYLTGDMIHLGKVPSWSSDFDAWAWDATQRLDFDTLADYKDAPGMPYAHPSAEHFTPLFVVMGAASENALPKLTIEGYMWGLSKKSFQIA